MNPLLHRHLYSSARRNRFFWLLSLYLLGVGILILLFTGLILSGSLVFSERRISMLDIFTQGRVLYWLSSILLLQTATMLAPISALGMLAGEREHRTLDLLRTTTLRPRTIVQGKLGAALLSGLIYLLAPLPLLLFGYWLGGVTTTELLLTLFFLMTTLLIHVTWALFISSLMRRTIVAVIVFYGVTLAIMPLAGAFASIFSGLSSAWMYSDVFSVQPFWIEALIQHGWVLLVALHPLTAAIASEALWMEQGSWFLLSFTVRSHSATSSMATLGTITLPSPWIPYTLLALLTTALLLKLTARRLAKTER